ncbi:MAG: hypothetical protein U0744_20420 [Gemmataceae bacterium]
MPVVIDRRSQMYLDGAVVDYHDEFNRKGFSISNPRQEHLLRQLVLDVSSEQNGRVAR